MNVTQVSDRVIEITDFPRTIIWMGVSLVLCTWVFGAKAVIDGSWELRPALIQILIVTLIAGGATMGFWERSRFHFDGNQNTLTWSRTSPFRKAVGGKVRFDQIHRVQIQATSYKFRVSLMVEGENIPITESYSVGMTNKEKCEEVKSAIESLLD